MTPADPSSPAYEPGDAEPAAVLDLAEISCAEMGVMVLLAMMAELRVRTGLDIDGRETAAAAAMVGRDLVRRGKVRLAEGPRRAAALAAIAEAFCDDETPSLIA